MEYTGQEGTSCQDCKPENIRFFTNDRNKTDRDLNLIRWPFAETGAPVPEQETDKAGLGLIDISYLP